MMKAIVCGAGIAGLTLAWWLQRDGWHVVLVEQADGPRAEGYMIDFFGPGYEAAERMGLVPQLSEAQAEIRTVAYVDPAGRGRGRFNYDRFATAFGGQVFTLMRGDLERVLHTSVADRVEIRYATTVDTVTEVVDGLDVRLSDGTVERVDLLVGADGIHSRVRELLFGPEERYLRPLGYHTASYLFSDEDLRRRIGSRFVLVTVPNRQVGLYPINDGRVAAWFVHRTGDQTLPDDPRATLTETYQDMGPLVEQALRHCPQRRGLYYDQVAQVQMDTWGRGRATLVGDACLAVSLLAGQGASMAMASAYVLADELRRRPTVGAAVAAYERRLLPTALARQRAGRRAASWLVADRRWRINTRGAALAAARIPGVIRLIGALFTREVVGRIPPADVTDPARQREGVDANSPNR